MAQPPKRSDPNVLVDVAAVGPGPYRINVAAELSGVPAATLRAWERRYGVPVPRRTTSAYRLYSSEDVDLVRRMRELVESGVAPAEAARTLLASGENLSASEEAPGGDALELVRERIIAATQRWDARAIDEELTRALFLVDAQTLYNKIISPLIVEVGTRWESGQLCVAQEHLLSEKLELALRAVLRALDRADGPMVLLGTISDESHVLGLLGAAIKLAQGGARLALLGAATPPSAVADAVRSMAPRLVGLSVTGTPIPKPRALFKAYAQACGTTPWVVGGPGAASVEDAVLECGGLVAIGPMSAWGTQVREWLRGAR